MEQEAVKEFKRFSGIPDSKVPVQTKYKCNIIELAKAAFRTSFRTVTLNRKHWRFDILLVDADAKHVTEFLNDYPMCHIENTFSQK